MSSRLSTTSANAMAALALGVSLGGTAYAAGLVTGGDIKNGSITAKDLKKNAVNTKKVKNGSLLSADFKDGQLPAGPAGPNGPQGPMGPSDAYSTGDGRSSDSVPPLVKSVPAGTYFVIAKVANQNPGAAELATRCDLRAGATTIDTVFGYLNGDDVQETLTSSEVVTLAEPGDLEWKCTGSAVPGYASLHAVRVQSSN